jgi:hypothetical protein
MIGTLGMVVIVSAAYGLWSAVKRNHWVMAVMGVAAVVSITALGSRAEFLERNFSHVLPILFVLAGAAIAEVTDRLTRYRATALGAVMVLALITPVQVLYAIRGVALSGVHEARIAQARDRFGRENPGLTMVQWPNLSYGDPFPPLRDHMSKQSFPVLVELLHYDDVYGERTLERFLTFYDAAPLGRLDSPFKGIPPSTLQAYLASSRLYYRVTGPVCDQPKDAAQYPRDARMTRSVDSTRAVTLPKRCSPIPNLGLVRHEGTGRAAKSPERLNALPHPSARTRVIDMK